MPAFSRRYATCLNGGMVKRLGWCWEGIACTLWGLLCATLLGACIPTPEGCNALDSEDECAGQDRRCNDQGVLQRCAESPCGNSWIDDACGSDEPICFSLGTSPARGSRAECVSEARCSATSDCARDGLCGDGTSGCVATEEGCAKACPDGFCGFAGGRCVPTDAGCASAPSCLQRGLCAAGSGTCTPTAEGCANSDACKSDGSCGFAGGLCASTAEGCAGSSECLAWGRCGLGDSGRCESTEEGCASSEHCASSGTCFAGGYNCKASAESCKRSSECAQHGFCTLKNDICSQ
jgi:hypothetical protein